jgi:PAS domain S-box-containing protein
MSEIEVRRQAQESSNRLSSIVEQAAEGIAVADLKGIITYANKAWAEMHGYAVEEIVGKHLSIFHTEEQMIKDIIPFNEHVKEKGFHKGEVGHVKKDGTVFPTLMMATQIKDKNNRPVSIVGFATDITGYKTDRRCLEHK